MCSYRCRAWVSVDRSSPDFCVLCAFLELIDQGSQTKMTREWLPAVSRVAGVNLSLNVTVGPAVQVDSLHVAIHIEPSYVYVIT